MDQKQDLNLITEKATNHDADAQYKLGLHYMKIKNYKESIKWFRKATNQGHDNARHELGDCYLEGKGVDADYEKAVELWRKGANLGHPQSQVSFGLYISETKEDYKGAFKWNKAAADQGDAWGLYYLSDYYEKGVMVEKDLNKSISYLEQAIQNSPEGDSSIPIKQSKLKIAILYMELGNYREAINRLENSEIGWNREMAELYSTCFDRLIIDEDKKQGI